MRSQSSSPDMSASTEPNLLAVEDGRVRNVALFWKGGYSPSLLEGIKLSVEGQEAQPNRHHMSIRSGVGPESDQEVLDDSVVTSMRVSRPATEGESCNKEEWLVNVVHPSPGAFFHQSAWMTDGAIVVVNPFSSSLPLDTARLLRLLATGGVRPILFIDRLDLALGSETSSQDIYERFAMTVATINSVLKACREELDVAIPDVSVEDGSVIFGALHLGWAFTVNQCIARCTAADGVDDSPANGFWWDKYFDDVSKTWSDTLWTADGRRKLEGGFAKFILDPLRRLHWTQDVTGEERLAKATEELKIEMSGEKDISQLPESLDIILRSLFPGWHTLLEAALLHLPSPVPTQQGRQHVLKIEDEPESGPKDGLGNSVSLFVTGLTSDSAGNDLVLARIVTGTLRAPTDVNVYRERDRERPWHHQGFYQLRVKSIHLMSGNKTTRIESAPAGHIVGLRIVCERDFSDELRNALAQSVLTRYLVVYFPRLGSLAMPPICRSVSVEGGFELKDVELVRAHVQDLAHSHPGLRLDKPIEGEALTLAHENDDVLALATIDLPRRWPLPGRPPTVSAPFVTYHETITADSRIVCCKTANKRIRIFLSASPVAPTTALDLAANTVPLTDHKDRAARSAARSAAFRRWRVDGPRANVFEDDTRFDLNLDFSSAALTAGFSLATAAGPLAGEPVRGVRVALREFATTPELRGRGYSQMARAAQRATLGCVMFGSPCLVAPACEVEVNCCGKHEEKVFVVLAGRGVGDFSTTYTLGRVLVRCRMGVAETVGLRAELRGATGADAYVTMGFAGWDRVEGDPLDVESKAGKLVREIRARKGMDLDIPPAETYHDQYLYHD